MAMVFLIYSKEKIFGGSSNWPGAAVIYRGAQILVKFHGSRSLVF